jgi:hypothetical protein
MKLLQIQIWPVPTTVALSPPRPSLASNEREIMDIAARRYQISTNDELVYLPQEKGKK